MVLSECIGKDHGYITRPMSRLRFLCVRTSQGLIRGGSEEQEVILEQRLLFAIVQ
jgi:hypothetical protein